MRFHRFLRRECIRIGLDTDRAAPPDDDVSEPRQVAFWREHVLRELVEVLDQSGQINNPSRLYQEFENLEKRQSSGLGEGIALPHLRTPRARSFVMGFCRSRRGIPFAAVDGEPVHFFFPMVTPPHDDRLYLRVLRPLAEMLRDPGFRQELEAIESADDVIPLMQQSSPW